MCIQRQPIKTSSNFNDAGYTGDIGKVIQLVQNENLPENIEIGIEICIKMQINGIIYIIYCKKTESVIGEACDGTYNKMQEQVINDWIFSVKKILKTYRVQR